MPKINIIIFKDTVRTLSESAVTFEHHSAIYHFDHNDKLRVVLEKSLKEKLEIEIMVDYQNLKITSASF